MPASRPQPVPRLGVWPAVYWLAALAVYAVLGAFFQPFFLLGFWQSIPLLLVFTWLAGRLFGGNGPVRRALARDARPDRSADA